MELAHGVGPALREKPAIGLAHLGAEERVVDPARRRVDVELGRHDVVIAGQQDRRAARQQRLRMRREALEPAQLVVEFRSGCRIAVRQVEAADRQPVDCRLQIAAMRVFGIAGQTAAELRRLGAAGENRDSVPALLPMPDRDSRGGADRGGGKFLIGRLQFRKTDDVRRGLFQPGQQVREPAVDAVDVVGRDLHRAVPAPASTKFRNVTE